MRRLAFDRLRHLRRWLRGLTLELYIGPARRDHGLEPATTEQLLRIDVLCDERMLVSPTWQPLSQRQAVTIATQLLDGTYNPQAWE